MTSTSNPSQITALSPKTSSSGGFALAVFAALLLLMTAIASAFIRRTNNDIA